MLASSNVQNVSFHQPSRIDVGICSRAHVWLGVTQRRTHGHNPSVAYEFIDPVVARALTYAFPTLDLLLLSTRRQLNK